MAFTQEMAFRDCPWCGLRDAQMTVQAQWLARDRRGVGHIWCALTCPRCGRPTLLQLLNDPAVNRIDGVVPESPSESRIEHLPPDVKQYYHDGIIVLEAGVPGAAAVQLRRTLEAAAAHRGVTDGPLVARIQKLIEQGHITVEFGQVLDLIRKTGNVGAHAGDEEVDEEEARRALRFTTQVLRNLFEIPAELGIAPPGDQVEATRG